MMFKITSQASEQIRASAVQGGNEALRLRIAANRKDDGGIDYLMGFDEAAPEDTVLASEGVEVVIGPADTELLDGAVLDYVEIEPGEHHFIFLNPNDPHYEPPSEG